MVPIQCEENPEGQNGVVIFEDRSYSLARSDACVVDRGHQHSLSFEPQQSDLRVTLLRVPIQCEENPEGQNGCIIFENRSYRLHVLDNYDVDHGYQNSELSVMPEIFIFKHPVQYEENPEGQNGWVIFDSRSYRLWHGRGGSEHLEIHHDMSMRCSEDQHVLRGSVELDNIFYTVDMPRLADSELIHEDEDFFNDNQRFTD